jgi:hypothetical protein
VLDAGGVEVVPHHLSSIVDADDLSPAGSREVHVAEDAAIVRKAAQHAHQVEVQPNHQTSPIDARSDAKGRARDRENLVNPARESERGRPVDAGIEIERADRGGAFTVENHRLRRARIVDARERADLRYSQPSSHGVFHGDRDTFAPKTGSKIQ